MRTNNRKILFYIVTLAIITLIISCSHDEKSTKTKTPVSGTKEGTAMANIQLISSAFEEGKFIPSKYTCDGADVSPPLKWSNIPQNTKTIALICDDPDAPVGTWVHWVMYNIPPTVSELTEGVPSDKTLSNGAIHGINDFKKYGYGGPCPPSGTHRYYFKIYALDTELQLAPGAKKSDVEKAMQGHILATGQLMGRYKR